MLRMKFSNKGMRFAALGLACLLVWQTVTPAMKAQVTPEPKLKIVTLEGEGAINNIRQRTARQPIVQVEDESNRPVAGAMVLFTLPDRGASGIFANGSKSLMVYTDAQGQAVAKGLQPNKTAGQFQIRVDATFQGVTASSAITQTNALPAGAAAGGASTKLIAILAVAGGAAAAGVVAASRGGGGGGGPAPPAPPGGTTITAGNPNFGPP